VVRTIIGSFESLVVFQLKFVIRVHLKLSYSTSFVNRVFET